SFALILNLSLSCNLHTSFSATNKMVAQVLYHHAFIQKYRCKTYTTVSSTKCFGHEPIEEDAYS
ncbi:unnamed protein product, partial [Bubo scandiacus]